MTTRSFPTSLQPDLDRRRVPSYNYFAAAAANRAAPPAAIKNTAAIQACGSGSLLVAIAIVIVSAAIPDIKAIAIQHR
jgi:hypothetical protein